MKYNKLFRYAKNGFHKRHVTVDDSWKVETNMLPLATLPLLAKELSILTKENMYKRVNPYKFDDKTSRHIYIEYAEHRLHGYELKRKMVLRCSNKGNFKVPKDTFLFDLLDYFVEIDLLSSCYKFIGHIEDVGLDFQVVDLYSKEEIMAKGFKFPA